MLKANGMNGILKMRDWPRYTEAEPEVFTVDEIEKFLDKCNPWKRVLFEFLLDDGFAGRGNAARGLV